MRNPLGRRLLRELRQDMGKYIALFLFLVLTIGFVSGFLVADGSMKAAYDQSFEKYTVEDGHFTLAAEAQEHQLQQLEDEGVSIYPLFYKDKMRDNEHTVRVFENRSQVNGVCLMDGRLPQTDREIALDRLYAENNEISTNDSMELDGKVYTVSGFVALSDYSALFKNNTDMMFDANKFTVAVVTHDAFEEMSGNGLKYCYAWRNDDLSLSDANRADQADELLEMLQSFGTLTDFVKREDNQAIRFTGDDMGSDKAMMTCLLYVVIVVLAFVFAVTTKGTIEQESAIIGTLRASGYRRGELLRHYLALPMLVTLVAAVIGNATGYTLMKNVCVEMYYHSYSLPTYTTLWNADAFFQTTVIPCVIILAVNLLVLWSTLSLPPLQFLRHDLRRKQKKRVLRLPEWRFLTRFRLRVILQNLPAYLTMFAGILFASVLLIFGLIMSPLLSHFKEEVTASQIANYQYVLKAPMATQHSGAEKYSVTALNLPQGEEITVYGIEENSRYLSDLPPAFGTNEVIASNGLLEKYGWKTGDTVTLKKAYEDSFYTFTIAGEYPYAATLSIFLSQDAFHETFGLGADDFSGYFSDEKLTDLDENGIASVITQSDLTVIADQLDDSMGRMLLLVCGFSALMYLLLMYLLAKLIVERNARSISMIKILGYSDREAGRLYSTATAIVVTLSLLISLPLACLIMKGLYSVFMREINGWMTFYIAPWIYPAMLVIGAACYFLVHRIQVKRIRRIPMSQALKDME